MGPEITIEPPDVIRQRIRKFLTQNVLFSGEEFRYADGASFLGEGIIDSLGVMELVTFVQSAFGVTVDPMEVTPENFDSVSRLEAYVSRKLAES